MEAPIGFIPLQEAVRIVGQKMGGDADIERAIAEGCEAGKIVAGYRGWSCGVDDLDRGKWRLPHWRNYFATGTIDLTDMPLLDEKGRPVPDGRTVPRCTYEIFVRRDSLDRFIASIEPDSRPATEPVSKPAARRGGSPPTYDLVEIKLFFQEQLQKRGDPTNEEDHGPGWKSLANAMKVISDHMEKQGKPVPDKTRFYEILNEVLSDYRRALADSSAN